MSHSSCSCLGEKQESKKPSPRLQASRQELTALWPPQDDHRLSINLLTNCNRHTEVSYVVLLQVQFCRFSPLSNPVFVQTCILIHRPLSGYILLTIPKSKRMSVFADIQTTAIDYIPNNQHLLSGQDFIIT